jgi:hypothetical protein
MEARIMPGANQNGFQLDARLIERGAWVFGAGALLSMIGLAMTSRELATATRRYIQQMDVPPNQLARQGLTQAKLAASQLKVAATAGAAAGADAWRHSSNGNGVPAQSSFDLPRAATAAAGNSE